MPRRRVLKLFVTGLLGIAATAESPLVDPPPAGAQSDSFVIWPRPRDITYGTALGPRQLNALAFSQGFPLPLNAGQDQLYFYTPPAGAVLSVGADHALSVSIGYPGSSQVGTTEITVTKDPTALALTASSTTPPSGQSVTVTATIATTPPVLASGAGNPTGTVTFAVDGVKQPAITVSNKQARFKTGALPSGVHTIGAGYSGDGSFLGSAAQPITIHAG